LQLNPFSSIEVVPTPVVSGNFVKVLNPAGVKLVNVSLIDLTGKVYVDYDYIKDFEKDIDTKGLAAGIYLVRIVLENEVVTRKILVY
jgi:hypothetical protein